MDGRSRDRTAMAMIKQQCRGSETWLTDEEVTDGQRRDEVVGWLTYRPLQHERQYHDQVAADRQDASHRRQQPQRPGTPASRLRPATAVHRRVVVAHHRQWSHHVTVVFVEIRHRSLYAGLTATRLPLRYDYPRASVKQRLTTQHVLYTHWRCPFRRIH